MQPGFEPAHLAMMQLEDYGHLMARYQSMRLANRACAVLEDAGPALSAAEHIVGLLGMHPAGEKALDIIRGNPLIVGKMRACEAKTALLDARECFVEATRRKLGGWRKTMERLGQGEDIVSDAARDYIPGNAPLAVAIAGISGVSSYLSIIQLAIAELAKSDAENALHYRSAAAEIRRCATVLSDYEHASCIGAVVN